MRIKIPQAAWPPSVLNQEGCWPFISHVRSQQQSHRRLPPQQVPACVVPVLDWAVLSTAEVGNGWNSGPEENRDRFPSGNLQQSLTFSYLQPREKTAFICGVNHKPFQWSACVCTRPGTTGPHYSLESPSPTLTQMTLTPATNKGILTLDHFKTYTLNLSVLQQIQLHFLQRTQRRALLAVTDIHTSLVSMKINLIPS